MIRRSVHIPEPDYAAIRSLAETRGVSASQLIREAILDHLRHSPVGTSMLDSAKGWAALEGRSR